MLAPRWRKVLGDLWSNKTRTALVVLSIAIGVFAIGMVTGGREILMRDLNGGWNAVRPSSASIAADNIDDDMVQTVRRMPGIEDAEPRRGVNVRALSASGEWKNLQLMIIDDFDDIRTYRPTPISGQWPPERRTVSMERSALPFLGVAEGDQLRIEMLDGEQYTLLISGVNYNVGTFPTSMSSTGYGYISAETAENLGLPKEFDDIEIIVAENKYDMDHIRDVANQVKDKLEKSGRTVSSITILEPGVYPADDFVQAFTLLLSIIGMFALLLSGFLVINTISALLTQQIRQIGVMKSIGARNIDIVQLYLVTVIAFGILSLFVAIPLGVLGAWGLAAFFAGLFNFDITTVAPTQTVLLQQIAAGLIIPLLAALVPIISGTRISVREAISGYGLGKGRFGRSRIDRLLEKIHFLSRPMLLSLRNTFRRKGRLALTLTTLTLAGLIFMAVISEQATLKSTITSILKFYNSDVAINLSKPYRTTLLDQLAGVPGVTGVEYWNSYGGRVLRADDSESDESISIRALPAEGFAFRPDVSEGRWLLPADDGAAVVNSGFLTDYPDVKLGSLVRLKAGGKELSVRVVGVADVLFEGPGMYVNLPTFSRQMGDAGRAAEVWLLTERRETALQNQVAEQAKELLKRQGIEVVSTQTETVRVQQSNIGIDMVIFFLLLMAVLLAAVGGLGLMGTMSINVLERTREIGVMRAIGAGDWAIQRIVITEGVLIGLISWAIGAILAAPVGYLMNVGLETVFQSEGMFVFVFSYSGVALWLGIVVTLATIASFLPAWSASRVTVRDVLAYE
ncbi:MAG: ABC transporter permease [Chloroflexales bacterium]|nr:ABC transporter permease [Chloroflexales bacterium]